MKKILHIAVSPRTKRSHSLYMAKYLIEELMEKNENYRCETLQLYNSDIPNITENLTNARYKRARGLDMTSDESLAWTASEREFNRFNSYDTYLISTPMWNYAIPGMLKSYLDLITHPGLAFPSETGGTLNNKKILVIYASGNVYDSPEQKSFDNIAKYMQTWGKFVGADIECINYPGHDIDIDHEQKERETKEKVDKYIEKLLG